MIYNHLPRHKQFAIYVVVFRQVFGVNSWTRMGATPRRWRPSPTLKWVASYLVWLAQAEWPKHEKNSVCKLGKHFLREWFDTVLEKQGYHLIRNPEENGLTALTWHTLLFSENQTPTFSVCYPLLAASSSLWSLILRPLWPLECEIMCFTKCCYCLHTLCDVFGRSEVYGHLHAQ